MIPEQDIEMVVKDETSETDAGMNGPSSQNIMGGLENTTGIRLLNNRKKLRQRFDMVKKLGQGTYGKVQLGINKETGQEVAIKTIKKSKIETEADLIRIRREIQIMSSVRHPNIIHIYEVFENREKMVLVMEYASGGELYDFLSEKKVLEEEEARRIFRQIACAVYYCHKHKICHRDLKLENILIDDTGNAKIGDFGLSNVFAEKHLLTTFCGSPLYASPEIVRGTPYYGPEVDCWSLGVLLYTLVYGAMPFDGSNFKKLVKQISNGEYFEPKKVSPASPLIRNMLTVSSSDRANCEDICSHWWVNEGYRESCLEIAEDLANLTPVRLDLLLSLAPKPTGNEQVVINQEEIQAAPELSEAALDMMNDYLKTNGTPLLDHTHSASKVMDTDKKEEVERKRKLEESCSGGMNKTKLDKEKSRKKDRLDNEEDYEINKPITAQSKLTAKSKSSPMLEKAEIMDTEDDMTVLKPSDTLSGVNEIITEVSTSLPEEIVSKETEVFPTDTTTNEVPKLKSDEVPIKETGQEIKPATKVLKKVKKKKKEVQATENETNENSESQIPIIANTVPNTSENKTEVIEQVVDSNKEAPSPTQEGVQSDSVTSPTSTTAPKLHRRGSVAKTAELLQSLSTRNTEPQPSTVEIKPRKLIMPGFKVNDAKKAFETKPEPKPMVKLPGVRISDAKKAFEANKKTDISGRTITATAPSRQNSYKEGQKGSTDTDESNKSSGVGNRRSSSATDSGSENNNANTDSGGVKDIAPPKSSDIADSTSKDDLKLIPALRPAEKIPQREEAKVVKLKDETKVNNVAQQKTKSVVVDAGNGVSKNVTMLIEGPTSPTVQPPVTKCKPPVVSQICDTNERQTPKQSSKEAEIKENGEDQPHGTENSYMKTIANKSSETSKVEAARKKAAVEIIVNATNKSATLPRRRLSKPEISSVETNVRLSKNTEPIPQPAFKTEVEHQVGGGENPRTLRTEISFPVSAPIERRGNQFRRCNSEDRESKERVIPIALDEGVIKSRAPSQTYIPNHPHPPAPSHPTLSRQNTEDSTKSTLSRQSTQDSEDQSEKSTSSTRGNEPIKKSPREYIIPILIEGEGCITPRDDISESVSSLPDDAFRMDSRLRSGRFKSRGKKFGLLGDGGLLSEDETSSIGGQSVGSSPFSTLQRHRREGSVDSNDGSRFMMHGLRSSRPTHPFPLEHNDSFSSAEDDDDDGFEILTAETLFSTLLSRVRNLTRRLNREESLPSSASLARRYSQQSSLHSEGSNPGIWTGYSKIETPTRRLSHSSLSRDDMPSIGSQWRRPSTTLSRTNSQADSVYGPGSSIGTSSLPRGGRSECGDSDASSDVASYPSFTPSLARRLSQNRSSFSSSGSTGRRNYLDDTASTRSDPDGVRTHPWYRSQSDSKRSYGAASDISARDYGTGEESHRATSGRYSRALSSIGDYSEDASNTTRSRVLNRALSNEHTYIPANWSFRRPHSVLDNYLNERYQSGEANGRVGGQAPQTSSNNTSRPKVLEIHDNKKTNGTLYETSFVSNGDSSMKKDLEESLVFRMIDKQEDKAAAKKNTISRQDRASSECRGTNTENNDRVVTNKDILKRLGREGSEPPVNAIKRDPASALPRLRDLQTKTLIALNSKSLDPPVQQSNVSTNNERQDNHLNNTQVADQQSKINKSKIVDEVCEKKEVVEKKTFALKPAVVIKKKLTPLPDTPNINTVREVLKQPSTEVVTPVENTIEKKDSSKIGSKITKTGMNAVNFVLNRFRKIEEKAKDTSNIASKPPMIPRARRAQSVYGGAISDSVLTLSDTAKENKSENLKTVNVKSIKPVSNYKRATTMEMNMNNNEEMKKDSLQDKMKDLLQQKNKEEENKQKISVKETEESKPIVLTKQKKKKEKTAVADVEKIDNLSIANAKKIEPVEPIVKPIGPVIKPVILAMKQTEPVATKPNIKPAEPVTPKQPELNLSPIQNGFESGLDHAKDLHAAGESARNRRLKNTTVAEQPVTNGIDISQPKYVDNNYATTNSTNSKPPEINNMKENKMAMHLDLCNIIRNKNMELCNNTDEILTPTSAESVESGSVCSDDRNDDEESVSERIRRKSYFSRFNEPSRKSTKNRRFTAKDVLDLQYQLSKAKLHLDLMNDFANDSKRHSRDSSPTPSNFSITSHSKSDIDNKNYYYSRCKTPLRDTYANDIDTSAISLHKAVRSLSLRGDKEKQEPVLRKSYNEDCIKEAKTRRNLREKSLPLTKVDNLEESRIQRRISKLPKKQTNDDTIDNTNGDVNENNIDISSEEPLNISEKNRNVSARRHSSSRLGALLSEYKGETDVKDGDIDNSVASLYTKSSIPNGELYSNNYERRKNRCSSMYSTTSDMADTNSFSYIPRNNYLYNRPPIANGYGSLPRPSSAAAYGTTSSAYPWRRSSSIAREFADEAVVGETVPNNQLCCQNQE